MFEHIIGNEPIKAYLRKALLDSRLPQTLLFAGPDGVGKSLFAKEVAKCLLKSDHSPDLHLLSPEGKSGLYAIDTLREMIDREHGASFHGHAKVFILEDADRMQKASSNALLKTLEEPTPDTTLILLSSSPQEIIPTILSRCVVLSFQPLREAEIVSLLQAKGHLTHFAKLSHGSVGRAFELAEHPELENQRKILFSLLAGRPSYPELSLQIEKLEELAEEGKEEDPVRANRRVGYLFSSILMWVRDQWVRKLGGESDVLFFPDEHLVDDPPTLKEMEKRVEEALMAYGRNMKLSVCLKKALVLRP